jgi:NAD(P)-dependent dehydrogenase (short-subunit alcohol dehydrogenase family)
MMAATVLIIGANRGIGIELARLWQARGDRVIGACRHSSPELRAIGVEIVEGVDVGREDVVARLREALGDRTVDVLFNNAGILRDESLEHLDMARIEEQFRINAMGPLRVTQGLLDYLPEGAKVGLMTSRMGSIEDNDSGGRYGYRMSKAALNAAGKSLAVDLKPRGIAVAIVHPGYVRTGMTEHRGHLEPQEAAERLVDRMDALNLANTGTFWHSNGDVLPW